MQSIYIQEKWRCNLNTKVAEFSMSSLYVTVAMSVCVRPTVRPTVLSSVFSYGLSIILPFDHPPSYRPTVQVQHYWHAVTPSYAVVTRLPMPIPPSSRSNVHPSYRLSPFVRPLHRPFNLPSVLRYMPTVVRPSLLPPVGVRPYKSLGVHILPSYLRKVQLGAVHTIVYMSLYKEVQESVFVTIKGRGKDHVTSHCHFFTLFSLFFIKRFYAAN